MVLSYIVESLLEDFSSSTAISLWVICVLTLLFSNLKAFAVELHGQQWSDRLETMSEASFFKLPGGCKLLRAVGSWPVRYMFCSIADVPCSANRCMYWLSSHTFLGILSWSAVGPRLSARRCDMRGQ